MKDTFDRVPPRQGTMSYKWDANGQEFPGRPDAIPMWVADTDFPCPEAIVKAAQDRAAHPIYGYSLVEDRFSWLVADWQRRRNGWAVRPEWVNYCNGVVPALNLAVQALTEAGEGVIIQPPVYYPFKNSVLNQGRTLYENPLIHDGSRWVMDYEGLEALAAKPESRVLLLCSPHNPVSRVFTREELERAGEICLRHGVYIVSDEIHSDLLYPGRRHVPIASIRPEFGAITVTAMSPSKTFNIAGLQISAVVIQDPELRRRFEQALERYVYVPNLFGSVALEAAYGDLSCEAYLAELMAYLWENYLLLDRGLKARAPKIRCQRPEATYLMWLDCRELGLEEEALRAFFVEEAGLGIEMGSLFGAAGAGYVRMNIGCTRRTIGRAVEQLGEAYARRGF